VAENSRNVVKGLKFGPDMETKPRDRGLVACSHATSIGKHSYLR